MNLEELESGPYMQYLRFAAQKSATSLGYDAHEIRDIGLPPDAQQRLLTRCPGWSDGKGNVRYFLPFEDFVAYLEYLELKESMRRIEQAENHSRKAADLAVESLEQGRQSLEQGKRALYLSLAAIVVSAVMGLIQVIGLFVG